MQSEFIESILCGHAVPSLLVWDVGGVWSVMDGGQRSRAMFDFRSGKLILTGLHKDPDKAEKPLRPELNGKKYGQLSQQDQTNFNKYSLTIEVAQNVRVEIIEEIVRRRNQGGKNMSAMEILNYRIDSDFLRLVRKLAESRPFKDLVGKINAKRMDDRKLVLRLLFAIDIDGFHNVKRKDTLWDMLTSFADRWDRKSAEDYQDLEARFYKTVATATSVFGKDAPLRAKGKKVVHEGVFQAVVASLPFFDEKELVNARYEIRKAIESLIASSTTYPIQSGVSGKNIKNFTWIDLAVKDGWSRMNRLYEIWRDELENAIMRSRRQAPVLV
jgi:hypothetical protein